MRTCCCTLITFTVFMPIVQKANASLSCTQPANQASVVCSAAEHLNVLLGTFPSQVDGYQEIASSFKRISDLTTDGVREFVRSHPSNTEFLIKYLSSLDDYYLSDQRKVLLANAALHELS